MSFGADEEILQDFLVEAGEILEQLSEQLVELESRPDDANLLNAIFRGFHTVKGGAGFLQLHELVECCHIAENVFDIFSWNPVFYRHSNHGAFLEGKQFDFRNEMKRCRRRTRRYAKTAKTSNQHEK